MRAITDLIASFGVAGRPLREAVARLTEAECSLADLVRHSALPRRTVEDLLHACAADLRRDGDRQRIAADRVDDYRAAIDYQGLLASAPADPLAVAVAEHAHLLDRVADDIAAAPRARAALDHVSATAETVLRRALWLDSTFELTGARVLFVGDHDLTSLALRRLRPELDLAVVDIDDRLLEFLDGRGVPGWFSDLRCDLAEPLRDSADLVFTDPPYTPQGVQLFLGRGLQGLRDRVNGRLVMAYGFSRRQPALGVKVQRAAQDLDLAFEAVLPGFNRYHGAQAVGSASDLYVCRPTARSWQVLDRTLAAAAANLYTHGAQSVEASTGLDVTTATAVLERLGEPTATLIGDGWGVIDRPSTTLAALLAGPGGRPAPGPGPTAVNLLGDPGPLLARVLLAVNAPAVAVLVDNRHPDIADERAQHALIDLLAGKYALRLLRSTPGPRQAVVLATAVEPTMRGRLLSRAHGKVANAWREALTSTGLTKNEARERITAAAVDARWLDGRLIDLPRHALREVLAGVTETLTV